MSSLFKCAKFMLLYPDFRVEGFTSQVQNVGVNSPFGTSILQATCQCSELACEQANSELSFSNR